MASKGKMTEGSGSRRGENVKSGGNSDGNGKGSSFKLNPNAKEWYPSAEEARSLYITFSNGFPLSEWQISRYFTWKYGPYVEKIDLHLPRAAWVPLFGKITFKFAYVPLMILNGEEQVKFRIDGRTIWCKKYNPRKNHRDA